MRLWRGRSVLRRPSSRKRTASLTDRRSLHRAGPAMALLLASTELEPLLRRTRQLPFGQACLQRRRASQLSTRTACSSSRRAGTAWRLRSRSGRHPTRHRRPSPLPARARALLHRLVTDEPASRRTHPASCARATGAEAEALRQARSKLHSLLLRGVVITPVASEARVPKVSK